jgi:hypothetical protein
MSIPQELMNSIMYKHGGLEHPCAKIIKGYHNGLGDRISWDPSNKDIYEEEDWLGMGVYDFNYKTLDGDIVRVTSLLDGVLRMPQNEEPHKNYDTTNIHFFDTELNSWYLEAIK